jgi:hypothetical protein
MPGWRSAAGKPREAYGTTPQASAREPSAPKGSRESLGPLRLDALKRGIEALRDKAQTSDETKEAWRQLKEVVAKGFYNVRTDHGHTSFAIHKEKLRSEGYSDDDIRGLDAIFQATGLAPRDVGKHDYMTPSGALLRSVTGAEADEAIRQEQALADEKARAQARELFWSLARALAGVQAGKQQFDQTVRSLENNHGKPVPGAIARSGAASAKESPGKPATLSPAELAAAKVRAARDFYPGHQGQVGTLEAAGRSPMRVKSGVEGGPWGGTQRGGIPRGMGEAFTKGGPSQGNIATHVEGHAAAIMHQQGIQEATLTMGRDQCEICGRNLPTALPPGSQLTVVHVDEAGQLFETIYRSSQRR